MQKSPYKFLDSYTKEDREIFFGRDKEIEELYSRVFESRILVLYGTSGTGKSSLINCGLANKFNDSDWLPVTVRRGININRSLFDNLEKAGLTDAQPVKKSQPRRGGGNIIKVIQSVYLDHFKPVYIIFDQFEELFIFGDNEEKNELITNVKKVVDTDLQCRFIFSVREEYLAGLTEFEKIIPSFLGNRIRIEKMTRQNAIKAIEGPCTLTDIVIEPGFSEILLEKLNPDKPEVELTYLQVYLDRIFRIASLKEKEVKKISVDLLDQTGEVKDLLGTFLEEQISELDDPESGLVVLKAFVSVRGTKRLITSEEVIEYSKTLGKEIDRDTVKGLIQKFIRLRILHEKDENSRYELRHDSLAAKIYEKITLVEKELLEIRQFLDNALNTFEKRQLYLTAEDLSYIAPYEDKLFLNEKTQRFISQSKWITQKAKRRKQNIFISTTLIIIAVLSFFTIWALKERSNAIDQRHIADEQRNSALKAKEAADSARHEAQSSRDNAVEKERQAILAQKQAEEARNEALIERINALQQKNRAEKLSDTASEQARIANEEKKKAEGERAKAIKAGEQARQLSFLSIAQNLALKSSGIEKDPELMGLLAVQAFVYNKNNRGRAEDPIIYEALNKAYLSLDSSRHSVFTGSPNEIRVLRGTSNGSLLSADHDGRITKWSQDGVESNIYTLTFRSPINYIDSDLDGNLMITQHDNNDLFLWKTGSHDKENLPYQELSGHSGFARAVAFSKDGNLLATAGRDSSLFIWDLRAQPVSRLYDLKTGSGIRAVVFCSPDNLILAQDDGAILLWELNHNRHSSLYISSTDKPLCLAWNNNKKLLVAGCSNGSLLLFDLTDDKRPQPSKYIVHTAGIDLITFNSDYSLLATSSWDKTIKFYNCHEFFEMNNSVGGIKHIRNLDSRIRSLIFTGDNKLVAGLADKNIKIWETSSEKLASMICNLVKRDMTAEEWEAMVGEEIPYENTCRYGPQY